MNRRGFLKTCLALGAAPAIVKAESLMKLWVPPHELVPWETAKADLTQNSLSIWGAQVEGTGGRMQFSAYVGMNGGKPVSKMVSAVIPPGVKANCVIRANGELDIVGGTDIVSCELFGNFNPNDFYTEGKVLLAPGQTLGQQVALPHDPFYVGVPQSNAGRLVTNDLLYSENFTKDVWTIK